MSKSWIEGIQNIYFASDFDVVIFFELIVLRAWDRMLTDFTLSQSSQQQI